MIQTTRLDNGLRVITERMPRVRPAGVNARIEVTRDDVVRVAHDVGGGSQPAGTVLGDVDGLEIERAAPAR